VGVEEVEEEVVVGSEELGRLEEEEEEEEGRLVVGGEGTRGGWIGDWWSGSVFGLASWATC